MTTETEVVLIGKNNASTENKYHPNPECVNLPERTREVPIAQAERRGLSECRICRGRHGSRGQQDYTGLRQALESDDYSVSYEEATSDD